MDCMNLEALSDSSESERDESLIEDVNEAKKSESNLVNLEQHQIESGAKEPTDKAGEIKFKF